MREDEEGEGEERRGETWEKGGEILEWDWPIWEWEGGKWEWKGPILEWEGEIWEWEGKVGDGERCSPLESCNGEVEAKFLQHVFVFNLFYLVVKCCHSNYILLTGFCSSYLG